MAALDSEGGVGVGFGRDEAYGSGAVLPDGLAARAGEGWRSNSIIKKSGTSTNMFYVRIQQ